MNTRERSAINYFSMNCRLLLVFFEVFSSLQTSMGLACFGHHLIHNVVTAGFAVLQHNVHNPIQTETRGRKQVLER